MVVNGYQCDSRYHGGGIHCGIHYDALGNQACHGACVAVNTFVCYDSNLKRQLLFPWAK